MTAAPAAVHPPMPLRAMLVEDNALLLRELRDVVDALASIAVVATAATEPQAMRELARRAAALDVLIVDLFLAQGSGLRVARVARRANPGMHIVALTNVAREPVRRAFADAGANGFFDKSTQLELFIDHLAALGRRRVSDHALGLR